VFSADTLGRRARDPKGDTCLHTVFGASIQWHLHFSIQALKQTFNLPMQRDLPYNIIEVQIVRGELLDRKPKVIKARQG
jgi:hypothetical protein